jgi:hypothetical protein
VSRQDKSNLNISWDIPIEIDICSIVPEFIHVSDETMKSNKETE